MNKETTLHTSTLTIKCWYSAVYFLMVCDFNGYFRFYFADLTFCNFIICFRYVSLWWDQLNIADRSPERAWNERINIYYKLIVNVCWWIDFRLIVLGFIHLSQHVDVQRKTVVQLFMLQIYINKSHALSASLELCWELCAFFSLLLHIIKSWIRTNWAAIWMICNFFPPIVDVEMLLMPPLMKCWVLVGIWPFKWKSNLSKWPKKTAENTKLIVNDLTKQWPEASDTEAQGSSERSSNSFVRPSLSILTFGWCIASPLDYKLMRSILIPSFLIRSLVSLAR